MNSTTINIRIGADVKAEASKTLADMGLDMSTAVKMFLKQVIVDKSLPFAASLIKDVKDAQRSARWDRQAKYALKHGKSYGSAREMLDDIL